MADLALLLAFWSWGSSWMLLWGLAGAVPLVIHLWNRRQQQVVSWAAMEFLLAAVRRHARRIRLEQWLLLSLRVLLLLLLAVAVADPLLSLLPPAAVGTEARGRIHWVLIVDGSLSMACQTDELSHFQLAQRRAIELVRGAAQGDGFTLLVMSDPPRTVIRELVYNGDDVVREIQSLEQYHTGANLLASLDQLQRMLGQVKARHARFEHQVHFFTDLAASTWEDVGSAPVRQRLATLAEQAVLYLHEVGEPVDRNVAVTRLTSDERLPLVGNTLRFQVEIENFSPAPQRRRLEMFANGRRISAETLELGAASKLVHTYEHRFELPGPHVVEARLGEDVLPLDDQRWLGLLVREAIRVLCVEGKQGAAKFVALALSPQPAGPVPIRPEVVGENALLEVSLDDYDCLFLCNIGRFGSQEASLLHDYVTGGGGLVTVLGDRVQADSYNEMLGGELAEKRVLPARLGEIVARDRCRFDPLQYQHPITAPFRGHQRSGLTTTPVWHFVRLSQSGPRAQRALAFDSGDAAVLTESIGKGRTVLSATAFSPSSVDPISGRPWTALATSPSFPPLVHEILRFAVAGGEASRNIRVGQPLGGRLPQAGASVLLPDGRIREVTVNFGQSPASWSYLETYMSGAYQLRPLGAETSSQIFGVNVDVAESDLRRIDRDTLPIQFSEAERGAVHQTPLPDRRAAFPLYRALLGAVLLMLLGESCLACWLGRRTA